MDKTIVEYALLIVKDNRMIMQRTCREKFKEFKHA